MTRAEAARIALAMHHAAWEILDGDLESLIEYQDATAEEYERLCRIIQQENS